MTLNSKLSSCFYLAVKTRKMTFRVSSNGSDGGVVTNYEILNGQIVVPPGTYDNGETISLFVLAEWLSSAGAN